MTKAKSTTRSAASTKAVTRTTTAAAAPARAAAKPAASKAPPSKAASARAAISTTPARAASAKPTPAKATPAKATPAKATPAKATPRRVPAARPAVAAKAPGVRASAPARTSARGATGGRAPARKAAPTTARPARGAATTEPPAPSHAAVDTTAEEQAVAASAEAVPAGTADDGSATFEASDGARLHYRVWRPTGKVKRLVILVHGFADHVERYSFLIPHLVERGAVVFGYDMRGNGKSPGKRGHTKSYAQLIDDLERFIQLATAEVPGVERIVYAHSTGAILAMTYLFDHPDATDRVVLSAPCLKLTFEAPAWKQRVGRTLAGIAPGFRMQAGFPPESVSRDEAVVAANKADPLVSQAITPRFYTDTYLQAMPAALARIEDLKVPFLVIQGTADRLVSPTVADEFEHRATVAGEIRRYEGGYHESHNDIHREEVFADLDAWLQKRTHVSGS